MKQNYKQFIYQGYQDQEDGNFESAIKNFEEAIKINPISTDGYNGLAFAMDQVDRGDEGVKLCDKAIELGCFSINTYNIKSICLFNTNKPDEAIQSCLEGLKRFPNDISNHPYLLNNIGWYSCDKDDLDTALEYSQKALDVKHDYPWSYSVQGKIQSKKGNYEKSLELFNTHFYYLENMYPYELCERAFVYLKLGKEQQALEDFKQAQDKIDKRDYGNSSQKFIKKAKDIIKQYLLVEEQSNKTQETINQFSEQQLQQIKVKQVVEKFLTLNKEKKIIITDAFETLNEKNNDGDSVNQQLVEMQQRMIVLEEVANKLKLELDQTKEIVSKHEVALTVGRVFDKAEIINGFNNLQKDSPKQFEYCKAFYWSLLNYFNAYRSASTGLSQNNTEASENDISSYFTESSKSLAKY